MRAAVGADCVRGTGETAHRPSVPRIRAADYTRACSRPKLASVLRLTVDVSEYGFNGSGVFLIGRDPERYVRLFDVGPAGDGEGYDGTRAWISDASKATYVQGNADMLARAAAWKRALMSFGTTSPPHSLTMRVGEDKERVAFGDFRRFEHGQVPYSIMIRDRSGIRLIRVRRVDAFLTSNAAIFSPPKIPSDFGIRGRLANTSAPLLNERVGGRPLPLLVVPVDVDGKRMRFLVDTGGQNVLSSAAARELHLKSMGATQIGGAGSGTMQASLALVDSMAIGRAYVHRQSFLVLPIEALLPDIDGIVGAELFARFAARIDYLHRRLLLAPRLPEAWIANMTVSPIAFDKNMPDAGGAVEGIVGRMTLDTGSVGSLDLYAPFVRTHHLRSMYGASTKKGTITGVGGSVQTVRVRVRNLRLGATTLRDVDATLASAGGGVSDDPTIEGNVGERVFERYSIVVFDYRDKLLAFGHAIHR